MPARRTRTLLTAAVSAALLVGAAAPSPGVARGSGAIGSVATAAGTTTAVAGTTTVTVTIPDVIFEGPGCMEAPVNASFEEVESFASIHLTAAPEGVQDALTASLMATASGDFSDTMQVCPAADPVGVYNVSGILNTAREGAPFSPTTFTVSKAKTLFSTMSASLVRRTLSVRGRVVAVTNSGNRPADGVVRIYGFLSLARGGSGRWASIGTAYLDKNGSFVVSGRTSRRLNGAFIRARLLPDEWTLPSQRTVRIP
jgi:hypothetical protein